MVQPFVLTLDELLFFLGISLTIGYGLSFLLEKYGVPNVVIYLITGFLFANIMLGSEITDHEQYEFWFRFVETVALGLIGFKIGIEMEIKLLRKHSKMITILILFEVIGAFLLVFVVVFLYTQSLLVSLILAGLATATAPAATIEVIRRLKAEGPLTQKLKWILAFDDVFAVIVVEGILSYLIVTTHGESLSILTYLLAVWHEIGLAIVIGLATGFLLDVFIERLGETFQIMELTFSGLILVMGLAHTFGTSVILACMTVGAVTVNREGNNFERAESYLDIILSPILIIFFLLVGAQVQFQDFVNPFPILAFIYLITRGLGKIAGIFIGADIAGADDIIKNNLGLGLFPQGGVALGLMAIAVDILTSASESNPEFTTYAELILVTIVVSTIFSEGIGAVTTTIGLNNAGETGKARSSKLEHYTLSDKEN